MTAMSTELSEVLYTQGLFIGLFVGYVICDLINRCFSIKRIVAEESEDETSEDETSEDEDVNTQDKRTDCEDLQATFDLLQRERALHVAKTKPKVSESVRMIGGNRGYMSNEALETRSADYAKCRLSKTEEINIINSFRVIEGMNYYEAETRVKKDGFSLRPLYIDRGAKAEGYLYDATIIGVHIFDKEFDWTNKTPSEHATIHQILDVGGIDEENRGLYT